MHELNVGWLAVWQIELGTADDREGVSVADDRIASRRLLGAIVRNNLKAAVGSEFSFRLRAASIPGCVSLVSDAEERARDGL